MAIAVALWSLVVAPGEPVEIEPQADLRITNAALGDELEDEKGRSVLKLIYRPITAENDSDEDDEDDDEEEVAEIALAALTPGKIEQATLDVVFESQNTFLLRVVGKNSIHVTGNYIDQAGADFPPSDDEDDSDEEGYDLEDVSSDVEVDAAELALEGDDDDDASRFEEILEQAAAQAEASSGAGSSKKRTAEAMDTSMDVEGDEKLSKAQKKKAGKKLKAADGSAVPAAAETPSAASAPESKKEKKDKKDKKDKKADKTDKATASASTAEAAEPKKTIQKELPGGLKIADAKVGTGKIAKKGNTVSLRYIGKLMNGQIFDSNTKGKPFSFSLGAGEVIKGWDEGIVGMAIGGERVLTIPPALAYGKRGSGKEIPPNSTLKFEVKLLEIK